MNEIPIERLWAIELKADDLIVVQTRQRMPEAALDSIYMQLKRVLPEGVKVIILDVELSLDVYRPVRAETANQPEPPATSAHAPRSQARAADSAA